MPFVFIISSFSPLRTHNADALIESRRGGTQIARSNDVIPYYAIWIFVVKFAGGYKTRPYRSILLLLQSHHPAIDNHHAAAWQFIEAATLHIIDACGGLVGGGHCGIGYAGGIIA